MTNRWILLGISLALVIGGCKPTIPIADNTDSIQKTELKPKRAIVDKPKWASKKDQFPYRPSRTRLQDLIHTELHVSFNWEKQHLYGKAILQLKPYFHSTDHCILDAKGFDIEYVKLVKENGKKSNLKYDYKKVSLDVTLDKVYNRNETYTLEIKYTAKPEELSIGGSNAITSDIGLYFINPLGKEKKKPKQIWTQGETEASSCWFPTIDAPNEKCTQDIFITVDSNLTVLSNGRLEKVIYNEDGTATHRWIMDKPHAPYLFMMAIGDFSKVTDDWNGMEVSYYVEPKYEPYARLVFGRTPQMIDFFSKKLDYPYPWNKYSQVAVRDYVSGAMENTSASLFLEQIQLDDRGVLDRNWDYIIAHELFHQWFGDLTTCESWSNLAMNESFANYSEYLWMEHYYGRDEADQHAEEELDQYLNESTYKRESIIRFHYGYRDDMFDRHAYNKGGRVLHQLRKYVGDDAFFTSLNRFLKKNEYQPVEIHDLRLAFEETTGEDLNWFFDQWFLSPGHPELYVKQSYSDGGIKLDFHQNQNIAYSDLFRMPLKVKYVIDGKEYFKDIVIDDTAQTFKIDCASQPDYILFDSEQMITGDVKVLKPYIEYLNQFKQSELYLTRKNSLMAVLAQPADTIFEEQIWKFKNKKRSEKFNPNLQNTQVKSLVKKALSDKSWKIRGLALDSLHHFYDAELVTIATELSAKDSTSYVRSRATAYLATLSDQQTYRYVYEQGMKDKAYSVVSSSLSAYLRSGADDTQSKVDALKDEENFSLSRTIANYYIGKRIPGKYDWFIGKLEISPTYKRYLSRTFASYLLQLDDSSKSRGVDYLLNVALNDANQSSRYGAYLGLIKLDDIQGVREMRRAVREKEKSTLLRNAYGQLEKSLN